MRRRALSLTLMPALGLLATTASPLRGQVAETARLSCEVVVMQAWANTVPLTLRVVNGEMARLSTGAGVTYGLTPRLTANGVTLHLFEILSAGTGGERMREVERLQAEPGARTHFGPHRILVEVQFVGREPVPASGAEPMRTACLPGRAGTSEQSGTAAGPDAACTRCCVACDGIRACACACAVSMNCASCCCDGDPCGGCP